MSGFTVLCMSGFTCTNQWTMSEMTVKNLERVGWSMSGFTLRYWTSIQKSTKYFRTAWTSMSGFTVKSGSSRRSVGRTMSEITVKRHVWRQSAQVRQTWQVGVIFKYVRFHGIFGWRDTSSSRASMSGFTWVHLRNLNLCHGFVITMSGFTVNGQMYMLWPGVKRGNGVNNQQITAQ